MLNKIVILGPESTGKSTLCEMLAQHYNTLWCPEFAREYLLTNGTDYTFDDLLTIAKGQLALEEEYIQMSRTTAFSGGTRLPVAHHQRPSTGDRLLFLDTDQYVMKVWCEYVFNDCHNWILRRIAERTCDLYLLCKPDLPWVQDELREYPDEKPRQELYHIYRDLLVHQGIRWIEISGDYDTRFEMARQEVDNMLHKKILPA
ncbi:MAG TPA: ATP-binding protein [Phnomibacter sp.]|nr:ATP-binding protein [Phnomibacter sp.]